METQKQFITPFRALCAFMLLPLGAAVIVQINDPDGVVWMFIYGYSVLLTAAALMGLYSPWSIPGALGYAAGFAYLVPSFEAPYLKSELAREGGGLLIAALWMFCLVIAWYRTAVPAADSVQAAPASGGGCGSGGCGSCGGAK